MGKFILIDSNPYSGEIMNYDGATLKLREDTGLPWTLCEQLLLQTSGSVSDAKELILQIVKQSGPTFHRRQLQLNALIDQTGFSEQTCRIALQKSNWDNAIAHESLRKKVQRV